MLLTAPSTEAIVAVPQPSVAVAEPRAARIAAGAGLHPSGAGVAGGVTIGGVRSSVHVAVTDVVAVFPHASVAVNVLVWLRIHPLLLTAPSTEAIVAAPQPSVAVALPRAAVIAAGAGLHPSGAGVAGGVTIGGVRSSVQVAVTDAVAVLPHASVAVNVLV